MASSFGWEIDMVSRHLENSSHILEILNSTSEEFIAIKTSSAMFLKRQ